ncbi:MAG: hypothetical protein IPO88_16610 [Nannocystis sp.]|uniref:hypothetical protein n=1 Tax=Nannocystis sp. TaxID=1962667 RepID=UPI0024284753|nr:hypothetical protein [Nannocystis sp.]MBK9755088.1 hypothetical protein [Nannocystis sp.]
MSALLQPDAPDPAEPLPPVIVRAQDELAEVCASIAEFWASRAPRAGSTASS